MTGICAGWASCKRLFPVHLFDDLIVLCSQVKRYSLKEMSGEFPDDLEMKLAMTIWGGSVLLITQPSHVLARIPATSPEQCHPGRPASVHPGTT